MFPTGHVFLQIQNNFLVFVFDTDSNISYAQPFGNRFVHHQDHILSLALQVLKTVRKDVLKGCKIVFSRVFPTQSQADNHHLWRMAEQLGATCSTELDLSVTHVVSKDSGTEKSHWALKHNKFLVQPGWIEAANYFWQRQPEENFSVNQIKN